MYTYVHHFSHDIINITFITTNKRYIMIYEALAGQELKLDAPPQTLNESIKTFMISISE